MSAPARENQKTIKIAPTNNYSSNYPPRPQHNPTTIISLYHSQLSLSLSLSLSLIMEEVWNDITLSSLRDRHRHSAAENPTTTTFHGHTFLDFLSSKNPPPQTVHGGRETPPASPPAAVALRLNSNPEDHQFNSILEGPVLLPTSNASCLDVSLEGLASAASLPCKRFPESDQNPGDRRHKRMIKNRESAARSRARKQAYTNELELEVAHLTQENAKLKKQQQQLRLATAAQVPKNNTLYRSSTAPF